MRKNLRQMRKDVGSKNRLYRIQYLRKMNAPLWVIRLEQVKLACNRQGLRGTDNRLYTKLFVKFVKPILDDNAEETA